MNIKIDLYLLISLAILTLTKQVESFFIFYFFIVIHELAHVLTANSLKIKCNEISFLPFGVNAKFEFYNHKIKETIVACAGPILSICIAIIFPEYKMQNYFIFFMNMLPIYPLDGGRILKNLIILRFGKEKGVKIYNFFLRKLIILVLILNIVFIVYARNYQFLFVSLYLWQVASEEIKKDEMLGRIKALLNVEI